MKRLVILVVLCLSLFCLGACIDTDEAMPHYEMTDPK